MTARGAGTLAIGCGGLLALGFCGLAASEFFFAIAFPLFEEYLFERFLTLFELVLGFRSDGPWRSSRMISARVLSFCWACSCRSFRYAVFLG
jgi:hypothetical protein